MIVCADDLPAEGLTVDTSSEVGPLTYEGGLEIGVTGATLRARVIRSSQGIECAGRLVAMAMVPCSRCLEPYALPVVREFDVSYVPMPVGDGQGGAEIQIDKDDLDVSYLDRQGCFETADLVSEQIYLALPMKPLCAPDCKGLCPGCGANRNLEVCLCVPTA